MSPQGGRTEAPGTTSGASARAAAPAGDISRTDPSHPEVRAWLARENAATERGGRDFQLVNAASENADQTAAEEGFDVHSARWAQVAEATYSQLVEAEPTPTRPARTPHHPALTGSQPLIPAGANRMGMDITHFDNPREGGDGSSTGMLYLPGYDPGDNGDSEVYVRQERPGAPWVASDLPGGMPDQSARTPQELMARVARLYGIHGEMRIDDERVGTRSSHSGVTTVAPVETREQRQAARRAEREQTLQRDRDARAGDFGTPQRREAYANLTPGTGPGRVAVGGTDADRRAARPRLEGESDRAYEIRTASTRDAALRLLNGHQVAGLRNFAREEGVVTSGSKADLVARLIRVLRDRHEDSAAIDRMVNADRQPTPAAAPAAPAARGLASMPMATQRISGREPVVDTVARIRRQLADGEISRDRAADLIAQLVQRFSVSQGDPEKDAISAELARIAQEIRSSSGAPRPTMTGAQLLAARRAARNA